MTAADRPVIVAYDASPEGHAAVATAADLFRDRRLLVVSVWEPGMAMVVQSHPDAFGMTYAQPNPEEIATVDHLQAEHAQGTAEAGARLARDLGADAEAIPVAEGGSIADTLISVAEEHDAAALVVGSRGLGGLKSKLFGSTSRGLLNDAHRPVMVVRAPESDHGD
jgi:nucleotide-binding universal stress UspA family protein